MCQRLEGRIALITGGGSGIGLATAKRFVSEGATVFLMGRRMEMLGEAVREIGPDAFALQGDVTSTNDLDRVIAHVGDKHGRIDILFINAGIPGLAGLDDLTEDLVDSQFAVNLKSVVMTVKKAVALMPVGSSIVLNASLAGAKGIDSTVIYGAVKAGVRALARTLTTELKTRGIRVNAVSPGIIMTPVYDKFGDEGKKALEESMREIIPLGRTGTASEVAAAVAFLASDDASYITGIELFVDGGMGQV